MTTIAPAAAPALQCDGITVTLGGKRILDDVELRVERGAWVTIVGPNGAGKSTLLRAVAGLLRSDAMAGEVRIDGRPAERLHRRERARLVALVPQIPLVPPGITVTDYVLLGRTPHLPLLGFEGRSDHAVARQAIERLDLAEFMERTVDSLSGGERQRAVIARALAQGASLLLLDEPTSSLDLGHAQQVLELIDLLRRVEGLTVLATLHDLTSAGLYADRLVLLQRGRVAVEGPPGDVLTEQVLSRHYGARVRVIVHEGRPVVIPERS